MGKRREDAIERHGERRSPESWAKRDATRPDYYRDWHVKHKTRRNLAAKKRYEDNFDRVKDTYLRYEFGISLEQYNEMFEAQNGLCYICHKPETVVWKGKVKALAVDHCHKTGEIRKLLCQRCNTTIGKADDSISLLLLMIDYLKEHANSEVDFRPAGGVAQVPAIPASIS